MKQNRYGIALAVKEHLHSGQPITRLEALVLYGVSNLPDVIGEMRKAGWKTSGEQVLSKKPRAPASMVRLTASG